MGRLGDRLRTAALGLVLSGCLQETPLSTKPVGDPDGAVDSDLAAADGDDTADPADDTGAEVPEDTAGPVDDTGGPAVDTAPPKDTGAGPFPAQTDCPQVADPALLALCAGGHAALVGTVGHPGIQSALDAAPPGGRVDVCPGVWPTFAQVSGKQLTLAAVDPAPGATVLSGQGLVRPLTLSGGHYTVQSLTVRDGHDDYEGGGMLVTDSTLELFCVRFEDNVSEYEGGGAELYQTTAVIEGCVFDGNVAEYEGGGLEIDGWTSSQVSIEGGSFTNNSAGYSGGGLQIGSWADDQLTLDGVTFAGNVAGYSGGAIAAGSWGSVDLDLADCALVGNQSPWGAGGLHVAVDQVVSLTMTDTVLESNQGALGAALEVTSRPDGGTADLVRLTVHDNTALAGGGALGLGGSAVSLTCTDCDLGTGPDDNAPHDAVGAGTVVNGGAGTTLSLP